jgi:diadenosine tetraphosphatase ApaH/serine/threonine PP2A family protein phosphatase
VVADAVFDGFVPAGEDDTPVDFRESARYLVNAGAVGQPRDGDPRAAFAIYDAEKPGLLLRRVPYPVEAAQRRILNAGLPTSLANRLAIGR